MSRRPIEGPDTPDWIVDLDAPVRKRMSDPRLQNVRQTLLGMHLQPSEPGLSAARVEAILRDCAEKGMSPDEIAVDAHLSREVVTRVLGGGPLLG